MIEEPFFIRLKTPLFLHCCPWWLVHLPMIQEVAGYAFESGNGNLPAFFAGGNIPASLRDAIRRFDHGYQSGKAERLKRERDKDKRKK